MVHVFLAASGIAALPNAGTIVGVRRSVIRDQKAGTSQPWTEIHYIPDVQEPDSDFDGFSVEKFSIMGEDWVKNDFVKSLVPGMRVQFFWNVRKTANGMRAYFMGGRTLDSLKAPTDSPIIPHDKQEKRP